MAAPPCIRRGPLSLADLVERVLVVGGVPLPLPPAVAPVPTARPGTTAMIHYQRRQLDLLLVVRRAERDGLVAIPGRRPPDRRGASAAGTSEARVTRRPMTWESGREDGRYVQQEQTPNFSRRQQ